MNHLLIRTGLVSVVVGLAAVGCGGASKGDSKSAADLSQYQGKIQSEDVEAGKAAYDRACASCHKPEKGGESLADIGWPVAKMRHQIREGDSKMPPISVERLSDPDMEAVLAYLKSIGAAVDEEDAAPAPSEM